MMRHNDNDRPAKTIKVEAEDEAEEAAAPEAAAPSETAGEGTPDTAAHGDANNDECASEEKSAEAPDAPERGGDSDDGKTPDGSEPKDGEASDDGKPEDAKSEDGETSDDDESDDGHAGKQDDESAKGAKASGDAKDKKAKEDDLAAQLADMRDRYTRLQAEWDNYRKRTAAERAGERERAAEKLVKNILPVVDDLGRALEHADTSEKDAFVEGVAAVATKLEGVLEKEGVKTIDPAGEPFDVDSCQAVGTVDDADVPHDTVMQVYQKGYAMGGRIIRPAMVTVSTGGPDRPKDAKEE